MLHYQLTGWDIPLVQPGIVIEKISTEAKRYVKRGLVPGIVNDGRPQEAVTELLFEKKGLIPEIQRLLVSC